MKFYLDGYLLVCTVIAILTCFLPLSALTYFFFRRDRSQLEAKRILRILEVDEDYRHVYAIDQRRPRRVFWSLFWAVNYATGITLVGLIILFLGQTLGFGEFPSVQIGNNGIIFPAPGSRVVFGVAFLGAYVWGVQYIFQRYSQNDLVHTIYFSLGIRMIFASLIATLVFNVATGLVDNDVQTLIANIGPAIAFLIGMFPQRGLRWVSERLPMFASSSHPSVREAPLEMIEGIGGHDGLRLEELGIETCYDLATVDFVPLVLSTPYSARQLVDWILQAKLCTCFGEGVIDLRKHGIRLISDLASLTNEQIEALSRATVVTESALLQAREAVRQDGEIKRMQRVGERLSHYTHLGFLEEPEQEMNQSALASNPLPQSEHPST
jgi:hypothetical protein